MPAAARTPRVIAHRGSHGPSAPENTLAAFEAALTLGAEMIELDVRRTADGALVVFHDPIIRRAALDTITHAELCALSGLAVPQLPEVLDWARGRIAVDVELKEDGYVPEVAPLLEAFVAGGGELLVTSFTDPVLTQLPPGLPRGLILTLTALGAPGRARACGAGTLVVERKLATEPVLAASAAAGLEILIWDYLPASDGGLLADPRIAGVITDDVARTLALRAGA
jgi:glycerophosphoryl diester phosphodiesterase